MSYAAIAVGVGSAIAGGVSAASAHDANEDALHAEEQRIRRLLEEIDAARENADDLREDRDVPSELFGQILRRFPSLIASIAPGLVNVSNTLAEGNTQQFLDTRETIAPGITQLSSDRLQQIQALNPENLGQDEIAATTRMLAPLLPAGTLDPTTGAVAGATTSPVSLYRNLISSKFNERRSQFLDESARFTQEQNNAATRQQVSAADFLNTSITTSLGLTGADIEQQQGDIDAQEAFIRLAASGLSSTFDPSANNALIAQGVNQSISSLGEAVNALNSR